MRRLLAVLLALVLFSGLSRAAGPFVGISGGQHHRLWLALEESGELYRNFFNPGGVGWHFHLALPTYDAPYVAIASRIQANGLPEWLVMAENGHGWYEGGGGWTNLEPIDVGGQPGRFIALAANEDPGLAWEWLAVMDNGRWWVMYSNGWQYGGQIGELTTPVAPGTWGQIKAEASRR
jgi:hypothetical protein